MSISIGPELLIILIFRFISCVRNDILPGTVIIVVTYERETLSKPAVVNKEKIVTWADIVKKNNNN